MANRKEARRDIGCLRARIGVLINEDSGGEALEWPLLVSMVLLFAAAAWILFQDNLGLVLTAIRDAVAGALA